MTGPTEGARGPALNLLLAAFIALWFEQITHELTHGVVSLLVGGRWEAFSFWATLSSYPEGVTDWSLGAVKGSAAVFNIACALACMWGFRRPALLRRPFARILTFYFGVYSLFAGFGYLFFDPIFANADSVGDWAKVTMMLGGGWEVRAPLIAVGAAGSVWGYFWTGRAALRLTIGDMEARATRIRAGLWSVLAPYVIVNLLFSVLALRHPLGATGFIVVSLKLWLGFIGMFWGYMIVFVWSPYKGPFGDETPVPRRLQPALVAVAIALFVAALVLGPGNL